MLELTALPESWLPHKPSCGGGRRNGLSLSMDASELAREFELDRDRASSRPSACDTCDGQHLQSFHQAGGWTRRARPPGPPIISLDRIRSDRIGSNRIGSDRFESNEIESHCIASRRAKARPLNADLFSAAPSKQQACCWRQSARISPISPTRASIHLHYTQTDLHEAHTHTHTQATLASRASEYQKSEILHLASNLTELRDAPHHKASCLLACSPGESN